MSHWGAATEISHLLRSWHENVTRRLDRTVGGAGRRRIIVSLAAVLALDSADKATVGAAATQLQHALGIGKTQIGLLLAISGLVGAAATVPAGHLVDHTNRTRLLTGAVSLWGVAMAVSAAATSFTFLLTTRLFLGVVTAFAGPCIASLIGDYVSIRERGRIYGFVLSGELIGVAFGFVVSGELAALSWRASFLVLVLPSALVAWLVHRLPEPSRGGSERANSGADSAADRDRPESPAASKVLDSGIRPREGLIDDYEAAASSLWRAVRFVLAVRTNLVLIVASALGYFFFAGLRGFGVEFAKHHYGIGQGIASLLVPVLGIGALAGVLVGGRLGDRLLRQGRLTGRVTVCGVAVLGAALLFVPALTASSIGLAIPLLLVAAALLGATNPPLDAARLDIIPPRLWGRAEAVRTVLRQSAEAGAPIAFGFLAQHVFGPHHGLQPTFLLALAPLALAALLALTVGRRTYPRDVATAAALRERQVERASAGWTRAVTTDRPRTPSMSHGSSHGSGKR